MDNNNFNNNFEDFNQEPQSNNRKHKSVFQSVRNGLVIGLCAGLAFTGTCYAGNKLLGNSSTTTTTIGSGSNTAQIVQTSSDSSSTTTYDVSTVAAEAMPSMVSIEIKATETVSSGSYFFGGGGSYQQEVTGSGSGIIFSESDSKLYILTNYHVVEDATSITATFIDNETYDATVTGYDEDNDLAVIEIPLSDISADTLNQIKVAVFADSEDLTLGEPCVAIGNALGYGQSVTVGYVSATEREVQTTDSTQTLIQTDAAINPGNSGGALLNMKGEVIGVNSSKYTSSSSGTSVEGMGFAIPVATIMEVVPDLISGAKNEAKTVYLGITGQTVTENYVNSFGWPAGVYVSSIVDNSPASQAGLYAGDIITAFNGEEVTSMDELKSDIQSCSVGEKVTITVARQQTNGDFKEKELTVTLGEYTESEE